MKGTELMKWAWKDFNSIKRHYCGPSVSNIYEIAPGIILIAASDDTFWYYFSSDVAMFKNSTIAKQWGVVYHSQGKVFTFMLKMSKPNFKKLIAEATMRIDSLRDQTIEWFSKPHQLV